MIFKLIRHTSTSKHISIQTFDITQRMNNEIMFDMWNSVKCDRFSYVETVFRITYTQHLVCCIYCVYCSVEIYKKKKLIKRLIIQIRIISTNYFVIFIYYSLFTFVINWLVFATLRSKVTYLLKKTFCRIKEFSYK